MLKNILDSLETWEELRDMDDEQIFNSIANRFFSGEELKKDEIRWLILLINRKVKLEDLCQ